MVDTGAQVSVFPATIQQRHSNQPTEILVAANGSHIPTYGHQDFALQFGGLLFQWTSLMAQVSQPLLGADFLRAHKLMPDFTGRKLIDASDFISVDCGITTAGIFKLNSVFSAVDIKRLTFCRISTTHAAHLSSYRSSTWSATFYPN